MMQDDNAGPVPSRDHLLYRTAFEFKVKEAIFFTERILALKKEIERPFLEQKYSESVLRLVREAAEPRCEEAAFYYDALLSATFSALDCLARAHSFIERRTRKKNRRQFTIKDISFNLWVSRLRDHLEDPVGFRGDVPEDCDLRTILDLDEKKFSKLRQMRNFYTHERHPIQDCDVDNISTDQGQISGVSLPLIWEESEEVDFIDVSSQEIQEDLKLVMECSGSSSEWFVVFRGII